MSSGGFSVPLFARNVPKGSSDCVYRLDSIRNNNRHFFHLMRTVSNNSYSVISFILKWPSSPEALPHPSSCMRYSKFLQCLRVITMGLPHFFSINSYVHYALFIAPCPQWYFFLFMTRSQNLIHKFCHHCTWISFSCCHCRFQTSERRLTRITQGFHPAWFRV